jgi:hypothetical protein
MLHSDVADVLIVRLFQDFTHTAAVSSRDRGRNGPFVDSSPWSLESVRILANTFTLRVDEKQIDRGRRIV